jgi:hypothetical protein
MPFISNNIESEGYITGNTLTATTAVIGVLTVLSGITGLPTDIRITGGTYSNGTATYTNNTGGTFTVTGFTSGQGTFTGGTVTGPTQFIAGLIANTISATTYSNLPTDIRVTGGTYTAGTATYTNNTGGTFTVTGFTTGSTNMDIQAVSGSSTVSSTSNSATWIDVATITAKNLTSSATTYLINFSCTAALSSNSGAGNMRAVINGNAIGGTLRGVTNAGAAMAGTLRVVSIHGYSLNVANGDIIKIQVNSPTGQMTITDRTFSITGILTNNLV